jgi:integrase
MKRAITKKLIDALVAEKRDRDLIVFDDTLAGFVLKVTRASRASFQVRYRLGGRATKLRTMKLGDYGPLTADAARKLAQVALGSVRSGVDPMAEKARRLAEDRSARTVTSVSEDFIEVHATVKLKPKSLEECRRAFRLYLLPAIGHLAVRDVTVGDVEKLHHQLRDRPATANRAVAVLSKFFSWSIRAGYRPDRTNPCQGLERFREEKRQRFLNEREIAALGRAIDGCLADDEISIWQAALFKCLTLTGLRRDELRTLRWRDIDFERSILNLRDTKTGDRAAFLSAPVREILLALPREAGNEHVFIGTKRGKPLVNVAKPWRRVLDRAGIEPTRLHDLRHSAASVAVAAGASLAQIGGVLGHSNERTTQRYSHLADETTRGIADLIATRVASAMLQSAPVASSPAKRGVNRRLRNP